MWVAAEEFLLINFVMDFLFLYLASRGTWFLNARRLVLAALFASVYSLADAVWNLSGVWDVLAFLGLSLIAFPVRKGRLYLKAVFFCGTALLMLGSAVRLFLVKGGGTLVSGLLGAGAAAALIRLSKSVLMKANDRQTVRFRVKYRTLTSEFTAIIDTGNLLTEPISAIPVLIADEKALGKHFMNCALASERLREAAFASVGGNGQLACLRADSMEVNGWGRWIKAPDMWLGLYPGVMRGSVHSLAPGVVFEVLGGKRKETEGEL